MVGPEPLERAQSLFVGGVGRYLAERAPYVIGVIVVGAVGLVSAASTKSVDEGPRHFAEKVDASRFLRGNLHTHTRRSDGDHPIEDVVAWYRDHGYAFVAITDHNQRTEPLDLADLERPGSFVVIAGEEVTTYAASGLGRVPVHVNALCHQMTIGGGDFPSIEAALRFAIDSARFQGGVALVNHPNFEWALSASDLSYARGAQLLEIWSGHPSVHAEGDALRPSEESIWEAALEGGGNFHPVAVDDMHVLEAGPGDHEPGPGRGWVELFSAEVSRAAICEALDRGKFYASSGALLRSLRVDGTELSVEPADDGATVEFSDQRGVIATASPPLRGAASYRLTGREAYVRARVTLPSGARAWTKAYVTEKDAP